MLREMTKQELAFFDSDAFQEYAVTYNLIYQFLEAVEQVLTNEDKTMMFLFTARKSILIWSAKHLSKQTKKDYIAYAMELMAKQGKEVKGVSASPTDVMLFAEWYQGECEPKEAMLSYSCPNLILPKRTGRLIKANKIYVETIAKFIEQFELEAFEHQISAEEYLSRSRKLIEIGQAYLWQHEGKITAMGLISGKSNRVGRINYIYVDKAFRRKGYAQMLVASLCEVLQKQNRLPVLYTMKENNYSNKAYKNVGFEEGGEWCGVHLCGR